MDTRELAGRFHEDGYLVIDDFFAPALMASLDRRIADVFGPDPKYRHSDEFVARSKAEVIPWFPREDGPSDFDRLDEFEPLSAITAAILGGGWEALYCMVMFSKPGTVGQAWHQDCTPESSERFNLNRLVYTRDIDAATGGQTVVVPGSHRRGELPAGDPLADIDGQVVLEPRRGTLVLLHGHTWHRVLPVRGGPRVSTNCRAIPAGTPEDITDVCVYRNMRYRFSTGTVLEERAPG
jgi:hypothetical protein